MSIQLRAYWTNRSKSQYVSDEYRMPVRMNPFAK